MQPKAVSKLALATVTSIAATVCLKKSQERHPTQMLGLDDQDPASHKFSLSYSKESPLAAHIADTSLVKSLLTEYEPSWFYFSSFLGNIYGVFLPSKGAPEHETIKIRSKSGQGGLVCYDVVRSQEHPDSKKVLFIVPGVNSGIEDHHISATVRAGASQGYHCVVINPIRPCFKKHVSDLQVIDFSRVEPISESVAAIRELFGQDSQIYAVGFSLGSNHLLRHLGAHENCQKHCGIRAAVSISGAFDIRANSLTLEGRLLGLYDKFILAYTQESFAKGKFKATSGNPEHYASESYKAKTMTEFDTRVRAPIFGYKGSSRLFRHVSCDAFISEIGTPVLALATLDDSVTDFKFVPVEDIQRNPNMMLAVLARGGHCNLFYERRDQEKGTTEHQEFAPLVALEYLNRTHTFLEAESKQKITIN